MTGRLANRTAIVTGAGRGIGRAIAEAFAAQGAGLVITDLDGDVVAEAADQLRSGGARVHSCRADAASSDDAQRTVAEALEHFGSVDILVNNAGLASQTPGDDPLALWDRGIDITLSSVYRQTMAALPALTACGAGAVLNICSIAGNRIGTNVAWYDAAKAGVTGLTRHLAVMYGPQGLRTNALCLGAIETQRIAFILEDPQRREHWLSRIPLRKFGQPEEAAQAAVFLVSHEASLITGQVLIADGGVTLAG